MDLQIANIVVSAATAIATTVVALRLAKRADLNLERDEIRRRKIEVIFSILGARYILSSTYSPSANEVREFNKGMSLFSVFFANDGEVSRAYDTFKTTKTDENLIRMLQAAAKKVGLDLLDSNVKTVLTVSAGPSLVFTVPATIAQPPTVQTGNAA